jgi:hypothetical protein
MTQNRHKNRDHDKILPARQNFRAFSDLFDVQDIPNPYVVTMANYKKE